MTSATLNQECVVFSQYLVGQEPTGYVLEKYNEAHRTSPALRAIESGAFDRLLLGLARMHKFGARLVDSYTALFFRDASARKKMVLTMAILESCAPAYAVFDSPTSSSFIGFALQMALQGLLFVLSLLLAVVLFLPIHLFFFTVKVLVPRRVVGSLSEPAELLAPIRSQTHERPGNLPPEFPSAN